MNKKNNNVLLAEPEKIEKDINDYLTKDDISIDEYNKIVNLYSNYKIFSLIFDKYGRDKARKILDSYEEKIFTIDDNVVMNDEERINLVLFELLQKNSHSHYNDFDKYSSAIKSIEKLKSSNMDVDFIKKKISLLEASLGYNNKFLNASYDAFVDCYLEILISNMNLEEEIEYKRGL